MTKKIFTFFYCFLLTYALPAQTITPQVINAGGGSSSNGYYQYEWSIGESTTIETLSTAFLVVTSGLLQPGTGTVSSVNTNNLWSGDEIKIFPNPVATKLEVDFFSSQRGKVSMLLMDESGKVVGTKELQYDGTGHIEQWDMSALASGSYFLSITLAPAGGSIAKKGGFKILKIK